MGRIVNVIRKYKGKINWKDIRKFLLIFIGREFFIKETNEKVKIDKKFIKEYTCSEYTKKSNQSTKKIKANLSIFLQDLIENCGHFNKENNKKSKHIEDAYNGWKKYKAKFDIDISINGTDSLKIERYSCILIMRCTKENELFLYDIVGIKKEADKSQM